nr:AAA family ATPase [Butyrivibrio sp. XBB1001]
MGIYVNPGKDRFIEAISSDIYVDKTELIKYTNSVLGTQQKYICVSRPRRFGKSMTAAMLCAYYDRSVDSKDEFRK